MLAAELTPGGVDSMSSFRDRQNEYRCTGKRGGDWDYTLCRALVMLKQSPWLLGTILDGSPLRHSITASWHSFC